MNSYVIWANEYRKDSVLAHFTSDGSKAPVGASKALGWSVGSVVVKKRLGS